MADVAAMAGENVTTAIRADLKELRAGTNARLDALTSETKARPDTLTSETNARFAETYAGIGTLAKTIQSQQREMVTMLVTGRLPTR